MFLLVYCSLIHSCLDFCPENIKRNFRVFTEAWVCYPAVSTELICLPSRNASICPRNATGKMFPIPLEMQLTKQPWFGLKTFCLMSTCDDSAECRRVFSCPCFKSVCSTASRQQRGHVQNSLESLVLSLELNLGSLVLVTGRRQWSSH